MQYKSQSWFEKNGMTLTLGFMILAALLSVTAYAFTTFETKDAVEKRLDRIESKLDDINSYLRK